MGQGQDRNREVLHRQVISTVISRDIGAFSGPQETGTVTGWITGGHSLLRFGIYVGFFPKSTKPAAADFESGTLPSSTGNNFKIYGWIADANGKLARASETPINGTAGTDAPDGWEGCSSLAEYEVVCALSTVNQEGEWRLVVVIEPADGGACGSFDELAERVTVRLDGDLQVLNAAS